MTKFNSIALRAIVTIYILILLIVSVPGQEVYGAVNDGVSPPNIDSKCGILYCINTDEILYSKSADKKIDPYSITKLMTCLLAAENLDLDKKVKVSEAATKLGGSSMFLTKGEEVTIKQLMYGTLVMSGNDAAYTLAIATCGNEKDFVKMMNDKAKELGCTNTHFANPHGLKAKKHYTTAKDFLLVAKAAFENETVREIAGTKKYEMAATNISEAWTMKTHVDLLDKKNSGVVAGKTGYWEDYDCSVVLLYDKAGLQQILVLLGSDIDERPKDAKKILEYGTKKIVTVDAVAKGERLTTTLVKHGAKTRVGVCTEETIPAYPKDGKESSVKRTYDFDENITAPLSKGDVVGTCTIMTDGYLVAEVPMVMEEDVAEGWFPSYVYISNNQAILLGSVFALLVILLILRGIRIRRQNRDVYESKH